MVEEKKRDTVMYNLKSGDGREFAVARPVAHQSKFLQNLQEDGEEEDVEADLTQLRGDILEKVIRFCEMCSEEQMKSPPTVRVEGNRIETFSPSRQPIRYGTTIKQHVQPQYASFIEEMVKKNDWHTIFELILASDYLHIDPLLQLCCATMGPLLMSTSKKIFVLFDTNVHLDKTPDQIEEFLGIGRLPDDLRTTLRQETRWTTSGGEI